MVQENRTFDNYFGKLGAYRAGRVSGASPSDVNDLDTLPSGFGLKTRSDAPDPGFVVPPFHERTLQTENLSPSWNESHYDAHIVGNNYLDVTSSSQFKMDNFLQTTTSVTQKYDPDGTRPMGYYDQTDLPYYYELASQFAISDNFHSPILSQTNPNRMYLFAATSIGRCNADPTGHAPWPAPTIFDELQSAGVFWRYYYQDGVFLSQFASWNNPSIAHQVWNISNLFTILASPTADRDLPQFVFIERGESTDEHPDNNIQAGAAYVKSIIDALMASNAWQDSVFILTYDEGGGLYDHVPPFMETEPDDIAPNCPTLTPANFNLSGFRLPVIVISPYAIPHYVSHTPMDTTSVLNFIEERFNLAPLTKRDAQAPKMDEFFDFSNPAWLTPPPLPDQPNECLTDSSRCSQKLEVYPNLP
jgi:phospholipase C